MRLVPLYLITAARLNEGVGLSVVRAIRPGEPEMAAVAA